MADKTEVNQTNTELDTILIKVASGSLRSLNVSDNLKKLYSLIDPSEFIHLMLSFQNILWTRPTEIPVSEDDLSNFFDALLNVVLREPHESFKNNFRFPYRLVVEICYCGTDFVKLGTIVTLPYFFKIMQTFHRFEDLSLFYRFLKEESHAEKQSTDINKMFPCKRDDVAEILFLNFRCDKEKILLRDLLKKNCNFFGLANYMDIMYNIHCNNDALYYEKMESCFKEVVYSPNDDEKIALRSLVAKICILEVTNSKDRVKMRDFLKKCGRYLHPAVYLDIMDRFYKLTDQTFAIVRDGWSDRYYEANKIKYFYNSLKKCFST